MMTRRFGGPRGETEMKEGWVREGFSVSGTTRTVYGLEDVTVGGERKSVGQFETEDLDEEG